MTGTKKSVETVGEQQTSDDGAAERSILLGALAQPQGHGDHTDDHRQRSHQYRSDARRTGVARRADGVQALIHPLTGK